MKWLNDIKSWFGRKAIVKSVERQNAVQPLNIHECRSVGIVYYIDSEESHRKVKNFVDKLRKDIGVRDVMALGYVPAKDIPTYLMTKLNFDQISQKDLNWMLRPSGQTVVNFVTEPYDVLIDLSIEDHLPIQHLVADSKAKFKVGRYGKTNEKLFDMMIDMAGVQSLSQYIKQVDHYLNMLNAKQRIAT
jgi:hypothetical protein